MKSTTGGRLCMLEIYVCEDDPKYRDMIVNTINNYVMMNDDDSELCLATGNPQELLNFINCRETKFNTLYFLDIELNNEMSGIALAAEIRKKDIHAKIVFVTARIELMYITFEFKLEALDFIIKNDLHKTKVKIIECLTIAKERYMRAVSATKEYIAIKKSGSHIRIPCSEILFFETTEIAYQIRAILLNRHIQFYGRIKEIEKENPNFQRCHHSFVVNITNIAKVNRKNREIFMVDGSKCYASVRYMKQLLSKIHSDKIMNAD